MAPQPLDPAAAAAKREAKLAYHRAYNKAWYAQNRDKRRAQIEAWRDENLEAYAEKQAQYRKTKAAREKQNAACARYAQTERGRMVRRMKAAKRRATEVAALVNRIDYNAIIEAHGNRCGICGKSITGKVEFDHIIALSLGGAHATENIQPAHPRCNRKKGGHEAHEVRRWLF